MADVTHQCVLLGKGGVVDYTPAGDIAAGEVDLVAVGDGMFRFATNPILTSALGSVKAAGGPPMVRIVKITGTLAVGDTVYWDDDADPVGGTAGLGAVTTVAIGNTHVGRVIKAVTVAATQTVDVQLTLGTITEATLANMIADPLTGNAIPVTESGSVAIAMLATGETNTLAAPTFAGQRLCIYAVSEVAGADTRIITCATTLNIGGNTIITLADVGATALLVAVEETAGVFRWRVEFQDPAGIVTGP